MTYNVEFTTTLEVDADNKEEAIEIATKRLEDEVQEDGLNQFYVYVNNECYN